MKPTLCILAFLLTTCALPAQESFPGLKSVLTPAEWTRAGLDKLSPDEIGVIDAALIRHARSASARLQTELQQARAQAQAAPATPAAQPAANKRLWERFGLPVFGDDDWRNMPPLHAKVVAWETRNRFRLDNGQVWEGFEAIPFELLNRDIEIHARPNNQFVIVLDGKATPSRIYRIR